MSARGVRVVNGKEPLLRQIVFEVRYNHGYNYLDRCGKILNRISKDHDEWVVGNQISPQNAPLFSLRNGCKLVFGSSTVNLNIDHNNSDEMISEEDVHDFAIQCEEMTNVVIDELGLAEFPRIGFRAWYHFPFETKEESDIWLQELGVVTLSPHLTSMYGGNLEGMALAVYIVGQDHRYRIGFESVERPAQLQSGPEILNIKASKLPDGQKQFLRSQRKNRRRVEINAKYAAVIDFDSYHEDPDSIDPRDFIIHNFSLFMDRLYVVLSSIKKTAEKRG